MTNEELEAKVCAMEATISTLLVEINELQMYTAGTSLVGSAPYMQSGNIAYELIGMKAKIDSLEKRVQSKIVDEMVSI